MPVTAALRHSDRLTGSARGGDGGCQLCRRSMGDWAHKNLPLGSWEGEGISRMLSSPTISLVVPSKQLAGTSASELASSDVRLVAASRAAFLSAGIVAALLVLAWLDRSGVCSSRETRSDLRVGHEEAMSIPFYVSCCPTPRRKKKTPQSGCRRT